MVAKFAWIIDRVTEHGEEHSIGVCGPSTAPDDLLNALKTGNPSITGKKFRLRDDDGNVYGYGRITGEYQGFEPLDQYGEGNWGCTEIQYIRNGEWTTL